MNRCLENAFSILAVMVFCLLFLKTCDSALHRQVVADYEQCLAWQQDGYPVQCNPKSYGLGE